MVLTFAKKVHFLQFGTDLSKKSKSFRAVYIYASAGSCNELSENANCLLCCVFLLWRN